MIWVHFGSAPDQPAIPVVANDRDVVPVRSVYVDCPAEILASRFAEAEPPPFQRDGKTTRSPSRRDGLIVVHPLKADDLLVGAVHPINEDRSALHLVIVGDAKGYRGAGQRHFSRFAEALRDSIESGTPMPEVELLSA